MSLSRSPRKFRRILDQEDGTFTVIVTSARSGEVTAENVSFLDAPIGEEAIGGLRARPILASERYAPAHTVTDLLQQLGKPPAKPGVFEGALIDLTLSPMLDRARIGMSFATQAC
jgi:hypothetical protein